MISVTFVIHTGTVKEMISHLNYKNSQLKGRYLSLKHLEKTLDQWSDHLSHDLKGISVNGSIIPVYYFGQGQQTILMWSQMHGNESTTTKGLVDFVGFLKDDRLEAKALLSQCTFVVLPVLNPDGAKAYTRFNANNIDLNRDFQDFSQVETVFLKKVFDRVKPDFCFNLHDQRTIFGLKNPVKPASISFLSPAADTERSITPSRAIAMQLIVEMHSSLSKFIPHQIGRFNDTFNNQCVGDFFQELGVPTILFEAGHFQEDYQREVSRAFVFKALLSAANAIATKSYSNQEVNDYFSIPENQKNFTDIGVVNAHLLNQEIPENITVGFQYKEVLSEAEVVFIPELVNFFEKDKMNFHKIIDLLDFKSDLQSTVFQNIKEKIILFKG